MSMELRHITVCICTFKRPKFLKRLLSGLENQRTEELFTFSVVVADNDIKGSAEQVVVEFSSASPLAVKYCVEPEQNIALARNKTIENASGNFIAFIDDDEVPMKDWLYSLLHSCDAYKADGVLGPVKPSFDHKPPQWIIKGKIFERPTHETGYQMSYGETRSGNVLFKREILNGVKLPFDPAFGTGSEDVDFFKRMMNKGHIFVWCNEAVVNETVPPERCKRSYPLRLALLRGGNSLKHCDGRALRLCKSLIALPVYTLALPFLYIAGDHLFMKYLIKLCDHVGRLLAFIGFNTKNVRVS